MNTNPFVDGIRISSFVKDSDRIFEGILITRVDGLKVVLNEQTLLWKKLTDLDNIKLLNEDFSTITSSNTSSIIGNTTENKKIKYDDLKNNFVQEIVGDDPTKASVNAESILSNKSAISAGGKSLFDKANLTLEDKSEAPENQDTATRDFNDSMKNIAAEAKAAETGDTEDGIEEIKKLANIKENTDENYFSKTNPYYKSVNMFWWIDPNGKSYKVGYLNHEQDGMKLFNKGIYTLLNEGYIRSSYQNRYREFNFEFTPSGISNGALKGIKYLIEDIELVTEEESTVNIDIINYINDNDHTINDKDIIKTLSMSSSKILKILNKDTLERMVHVKEAYKKFHPLLQKFLEYDNDDLEHGYIPSKDEINESLKEKINEDDLYDWARNRHESGKIDNKTFNLIQDYIHDYRKDDKHELDDKNNEKFIKYENDEYLDIPEEVKTEVMKDILDLLNKKETDIENKIKQLYELSDNDAAEFVIQGMELYLKNSNIDPKNSIKDIEMEEIEKSFEDTIDKYSGPDDEILDYLADTYEIDSNEAERIVEKTKGNLTETIYSFINIIRNRLKETEKRQKKINILKKR
jgi:hypothetical protein